MTYHENDKALLNDFYVVAVISNPVRYQSRYDLYFDFMRHMHESGVKVMTVELQLGERQFQVTHENNPMHIQLRTNDEIWHKENMINIGISKLPSSWKYCAWIDCDIAFVSNKDWALETVQQLQHYQFVQMFQNAIDLGPKGELIQSHNGFMWSYLDGKPFGKGYTHWHPGFAWAARREAINHVGGLLDIGILGSGDHHMALSMIGRADVSFPSQFGYSSEYVRHIMRWQSRCEKLIKRNVGYVSGTIVHHWHGRKKDRRYRERWQILIENNYDPEIDLKRDAQGLYSLASDNIALRDDIRQYFRVRNEDSIDI
jgi:hypothetical protein